MPKGTIVHMLAEALERRGYPKGNAIAIAQSKTGQSYMTGKPIKKRHARKKRDSKQTRKAR